ncbi:hypothetical protein A0H81_10185 [Grifola frondosa]|uniref:BTB domain-containing protein n=1 Tax=Grifola frondosa TaxID=5627 RepID=A0A1C7LYB7_GRIFR|nr:hypothetical protein A0H81_10185 [Grifola frondosa]
MSEGSRKKRARSDDVEISRDDEFWYKDGNIVLIAGNIAFRVYQGLLAEQSQVFMDLFVVPQPAGAETMDDCAMVHLSDSPEDLRHLLRALFKNNNFLPGSEDSVDFASSLRLVTSWTQIPNGRGSATHSGLAEESLHPPL